MGSLPCWSAGLSRKEGQEQLLQRAEFKEHIRNLQLFVESSSPVFYDEAYTTGEF